MQILTSLKAITKIQARLCERGELGGGDWGIAPSAQNISGAMLPYKKENIISKAIS